MTREDLEAYIHNQFEGTTTNTPWTQFPHYKVFRHQGNHKWFALVMNITTDKLGWSSIRPIDVLNIKCERRLSQGTGHIRRLSYEQGQLANHFFGWLCAY